MRNVTDVGQRVWECTQEGEVPAEAVAGKDVYVSCTTPSLAKPVRLKVGWEWTKVSDNGLARMITLASPVPRR